MKITYFTMIAHFARAFCINNTNFSIFYFRILYTISFVARNECSHPEKTFFLYRTCPLSKPHSSSSHRMACMILYHTRVGSYIIHLYDLISYNPPFATSRLRYKKTLTATCELSVSLPHTQPQSIGKWFLPLIYLVS